MDLLSLPFSATYTKCEIALCVNAYTAAAYTHYTTMHALVRAHMFVSLLLYYTHLFMEVNSTLIFFNKGKKGRGVWVHSEGRASCYTPVCLYGIAIITTTIITLKTLEQQGNQFFFLANFSAFWKSLNTK